MKKNFKVYTPNRSVKFYLFMYGVFVATIAIVSYTGCNYAVKKTELYISLQEEVKLNNELMRGE